MEEKESNNQKKKSVIKVSVYLDLGLLAKINNYCAKKGYGSRSELFRRAFETHSHIFPLEPHESKRKSLGEMLEENREKLEAIDLKLNMMEKQEKLNINAESLLELREQKTHHKIKNIPISDIPDFQTISELLLNLIHESKGGIKDFTLMGHMRVLGHSEATIWLILYKLQEMGKIGLIEGEWKLA